MASWDNAPVWAKSMVKDWRVKASIPDTVTDDEMYAALAYMSISGIGGPDTDAEIEVLREHLDLGQRPTPVYFPRSATFK